MGLLDFITGSKKPQNQSPNGDYGMGSDTSYMSSSQPLAGASPVGTAPTTLASNGYGSITNPVSSLGQTTYGSVGGGPSNFGTLNPQQNSYINPLNNPLPGGNDTNAPVFDTSFSSPTNTFANTTAPASDTSVPISNSPINSNALPSTLTGDNLTSSAPNTAPQPVNADETIFGNGQLSDLYKQNFGANVTDPMGAPVSQPASSPSSVVTPPTENSLSSFTNTSAPVDAETNVLSSSTPDQTTQQESAPTSFETTPNPAVPNFDFNTLKDFKMPDLSELGIAPKAVSQVVPEPAVDIANIPEAQNDQSNSIPNMPNDLPSSVPMAGDMNMSSNSMADLNLDKSDLVTESTETTDATTEDASSLPSTTFDAEIGVTPPTETPAPIEGSETATDLQSTTQDTAAITNIPSVPNFNLPTDIEIPDLTIPIDTSTTNVATQDLGTLPPQELIQETPVEEQAPVSNAGGSAKVVKKIFKKIALIGLSGPNYDPNLGNNVGRIVKNLFKSDIDVVIDSKEGLGEFALQAAADLDKKVTGIYLKPYLSSESAKSSAQMKENEGFSFIYSNYLERLRHITKDARLFVAFDSGGVHNMSILMTVWTLSNMYKGQHKPLVLFGSSWNEKLSSLKTLLNLKDEDLRVINVVSTPEELITTIDKLNDEISATMKAKVEKVVDRRVEGDEKDFIVY